MTDTNAYPRPLLFPQDRLRRIGHFLLILMMLPMLFPMTLIGMIFGRYGKALRHATLAQQHAASMERSTVTRTAADQ